MAIYEELDEAAAIQRKLGAPVIDTTELSIEETAVPGHPPRRAPPARPAEGEGQGRVKPEATRAPLALGPLVRLPRRGRSRSSTCCSRRSGSGCARPRGWRSSGRAAASAAVGTATGGRYAVCLTSSGGGKRGFLAAAEPSETQKNVYMVEVALVRAETARLAHDAKLIVASSAGGGGTARASSAARRWPGHTPLHVVSIRVDHSGRARRFLRRWLEEIPCSARQRERGAERPPPSSSGWQGHARYGSRRPLVGPGPRTISSSGTFSGRRTASGRPAGRGG